jgi:hypothetical protein
MIREIHTKQAIREVNEMKLLPKEKEHFIGLLECVDSEDFVDVLRMAQGISARRFFEQIKGDSK